VYTQRGTRLIIGEIRPLKTELFEGDPLTAKPFSRVARRGVVKKGEAQGISPSKDFIY